MGYGTSGFYDTNEYLPKVADVAGYTPAEVPDYHTAAQIPNGPEWNREMSGGMDSIKPYMGPPEGLYGVDPTPHKEQAQPAPQQAQQPNSNAQGANIASSALQSGGGTPWGAIIAAASIYKGNVDQVSRKRKIKLKDMSRLAFPSQSGMFGDNMGGSMGGLYGRR